MGQKYNVIMPRTLEKVEGAYCFGLVHPSMSLLQNLLRYSFEISYMDSSSNDN